MAIPVVLLEIASEAAVTAIVTSPTVTLDLVVESDIEVKPYEALPSPDYVPSSPIHAPASLDYHPRLDNKSEPMEDESEPIEDAPESATPLSILYLSHSPQDLASLSVSLSAAPSVLRFGPSRRRSRLVSSSSSSSSSSGTSSTPFGLLPHRRHLDVTIEATAEPDSPPVHQGLTVEERLDE
ncbi:hypothetical protein Tco_0475831 [Tanacetum coccineum]